MRRSVSFAVPVFLAGILMSAPPAAAASDGPWTGISKEDIRRELDLRDVRARQFLDPFSLVPPQDRMPVTLDPKFEKYLTSDLVARWHELHGYAVLDLNSADETDPDVQDYARSVCAIVESIFVKPTDDGYRVRVYSVTLENVPGEASPTDVLYLRGTGFLVGGSVVATSAHLSVCDPTEFAFLFGLKDFENVTVDEAGVRWLPLEPQQVYFGKCVRAIAHGGDAASIQAQDWSLYGVDRLVEGDADGERKRFPIAEAVHPDDEVYVVGHPFGLPLRFAFGAVATVGNVGFNTDLCTYPANSGSPVVRIRTDGDVKVHEVVGVHRGQDHCTGEVDGNDVYIGCSYTIDESACDSDESRIAGMRDVLGYAELVVASENVVYVRWEGGTKYRLEPSPVPVILPIPRNVRNLEVLDSSGVPSTWRSFPVRPGAIYRLSGDENGATGLAPFGRPR